MSRPPDERMNELYQLFFESAGELVQKLNDEGLRLERTPGDAEAVRSLRRIVHTLKGDSAACGFRELSELAHEFEDVLSLENPSTAPLVPEIALRAADGFTVLLEAYRNDKKLPDIQPLRDEIARLAHPQKEVAAAPKKPRTKAVRVHTPWSEYEQLAIARAQQEDKRIHHVVVLLDPLCSMPIAARQMIQLALSGLGELLAVYPAEGSMQGIKEIQAALVSTKPAEAIRAKCSIPTISSSVKVTPLRAKKQQPADLGTAPNAETESEGQQQPAVAQTIDSATVPEPAPSAITMTPENILRVDAERIDNVLTLVGELILAKSMLQRTLAEFGQRFPKDPLRATFSDAMAFQARVLNDLQRSVMKIRMVPVDQLFRRFPRTVRDVARQCGKDVELVIRGGDTDLDKSILDSIAEPLMHILRNAIGHGIETTAERTQVGKKPQGTLRLNAYHQGNQVVIEIADDGKGINAEQVRQRAISQGLLTAEDASLLTEAETLELILRPGFSTAEEITELSGRGVGLDVVRSVLARLKGTVQIDTAIGRGTTFRLRLPLTLAILRALLFRVDKRLYALPLNAVAEITRTTEENIHQVEHYEVLQLRDDVLPLLRLGSARQFGSESGSNKVFVLVINHGERKFGLVVNELAGEDELVIKALDDQSVKTDLVSGASILGDGRVVLILNLIALVERFTRGPANGEARMAGLLSNLNGTLGPRTPQPNAMARGQA